MPKAKNISEKPQKGLTDAELIAKYETGKQPVAEMINVLLSKPNPNAPTKIVKRP